MVAYNNAAIGTGKLSEVLNADRDFFSEVVSNHYGSLFMSHAPYAIVNYVDAIAKIPNDAANRNELVSLALFGIIEAATQVAFRAMPSENILDLRKAMAEIFEEATNGK